MIEIKERKYDVIQDSKINIKHNKRIILNVGGIKYETYRSTLTAYPNTLLGTMFADRNLSLLHKTDDNEYFIDRNGHAFYYILEFYRTGKLSWKEEEAKCVCGGVWNVANSSDGGHTDRNGSNSSSVVSPLSPLSSSSLLSSSISSSSSSSYPFSSHTHIHSQSSTPFPYRPRVTREELFSELHYFQLPVHAIFSSFTHRAAGHRLTLFTQALEKVLYILASEFQSSIRIDFRKNQQAPHITVLSSENEETVLKTTVAKAVKPFRSVGYTILDKFGEEIRMYLESEVEGLKFDLSHVDNFNWFRLEMKIDYLDREIVLENSTIGDKWRVENVEYRATM